MSKFENPHFIDPSIHIREDEGGANSPRVVKTSEPVIRKVQDFRMSDLHHSNNTAVPKKGGVDSKKDQRFMLSQLAREALSVGREEDLLVERKVQEKLLDLAETTRKEAYEKGHAEGKKAGHEEAYQAFLYDSAERIDMLVSLVQSMEKAKSELFEANQEFLIGLIYRIAKMVLLRETSTDKEYLLRLSRELIDRSGLRENLTLKIHPKDASSLDLLKEGLMQSFSTLRNLSVELSDHVSQGGCILETEWGAIDASLETQISQVMSTLEAAKGTSS